MIGDKILTNRNDYRRAKKILKHILDKHKIIITIGGGSGTRKTELMEALQELLYKKNKLSLGISLDDMYKIHFNFRNEERKAKGLKSVGIKEIDWSLVKNIIHRFKKGKKIYSQVINKYTNSIMLQEIDGRGIDYLIIEGLYANYLKKLKLSDFAIHLEGTPKDTLKFRLRRKKEDEKDEFRKKVVEKEYKEVLKLKKYADYIL